MTITVPTEGRPTTPTSSAVLVGTNGNAFCVMGVVRYALKRAGATPTYVEAYTVEAMSGDYEHLLATSVAYLEAQTVAFVKGFADNEHHRAPLNSDNLENVTESELRVLDGNR